MNIELERFLIDRHLTVQQVISIIKHMNDTATIGWIAIQIIKNRRVNLWIFSTAISQ